MAQDIDYTRIVKVFHISLLYFPIGNGSIYHGKTLVHEIETNERLTVHITNPLTGEVFDATNILPEYFFISVPSFNDRLEKEIDDWLYVMKYDRIPEIFHSAYMKQVEEKLSILKMTLEERNNYYYYRKKLYNDRDELEAAEARGVEKVAKNLLLQGIDVETISKATGLSLEEIKKLKG